MVLIGSLKNIIFSLNKTSNGEILKSETGSYFQLVFTKMNQIVFAIIQFGGPFFMKILKFLVSFWKRWKKRSLYGPIKGLISSGTIIITTAIPNFSYCL